jgi:hypothetical protein
MRWGIEGASAWGRHTAIFPLGRGHDVRDVCPNRTGRHDRARQRGKSDTLDAERIARETLAHPLLPRAFKRAGVDAGPDEQTELLSIWWTARCTLLKCRQQLLSEAEAILRELPLTVIERLPDRQAVRPRLTALAGATGRRRFDPPAALRRRLLEEYRARIAELDAEEKAITRELRALVQANRTTLGRLCGLSTVSIAELLVEVGDPRRFTEGGFARFNASAPPVASTAEGPGEPVRHRYNPGGNRRVNAILHRMAVTQPRCEPRAQLIYANATRQRTHQEGGPAHPQAPPLGRHLPSHDPRPGRRTRPALSPSRPTPRGDRAPRWAPGTEPSGDLLASPEIA